MSEYVYRDPKTGEVLYSEDRADRWRANGKTVFSLDLLPARTAVGALGSWPTGARWLAPMRVVFRAAKAGDIITTPRSHRTAIHQTRGGCKPTCSEPHDHWDGVIVGGLAPDLVRLDDAGMAVDGPKLHPALRGRPTLDAAISNASSAEADRRLLERASRRSKGAA
jgi:hypothetical protein